MLFVPRLENIDREESVVIELSGMSGTKRASAPRAEPVGRVAANGHEPHEWDHWDERYQTGTSGTSATKWAPTSTRRAILVLGARAGKYRS